MIEEGNIDDFLRLKNNLLGGIIQIAKRHAVVNIENKRQGSVNKKDTLYVDINNLYGGTMHRMMLYELVGVSQREHEMKKINQDPNKWVKSLNTLIAMDTSMNVISKHPKNSMINSMIFLSPTTKGWHVFR